MGFICEECGLRLKPIPTFQAHSPELVHSSKIFSPGDINDSQATMSRIEDTINMINSEIHHISRHLVSLRSDRIQLQAALSTHRSIIAPFRKLHPEILANIFAHCGLVPSLAHMSLHAPKGSCNRSSIGLVCKQWRAVLNRTPSLWSSIRIHDTGPPDGLLAIGPLISMDIIVKRLERMLSRSGAHPLTLYVDIYHIQLDEFRAAKDSELVDRFNQLLVLHAPRWHRVEFATLPKGVTFPRELPLIEYIKIPSHIGMDGMQISSAPKLQSACIWGIEGLPVNIALPWANLLRLCMAPVFTGWQQILLQCGNLRELRIVIYPPSDVWHDIIDTADHPIVLSTIRILSVTFTNSETNQKAILDSMTLPNLNQVTLNHYVLHSDVPLFTASSLSRMLIRSRCIVTSLHIGRTCDIQGIQSILPVLDAVTDFSWESEYPRSYKDFPHHAMSFFLALIDDPTLLPHLTTLTILTDNIHPSLYLDLIDSRRNPSAYALRKAASSFDSLSHIRDADGLRGLLKLVTSVHNQNQIPASRLQTVIIKGIMGTEWHQDMVQGLKCLQSEGLAVSWAVTPVTTV